jgi:hypothetical protein
MAAKSESLEERIAQIRARRAAQALSAPAKAGWKAAFGAVKDDELFREAARLGEEWRKQENQRR